MLYEERRLRLKRHEKICLSSMKRHDHFKGFDCEKTQMKRCDCKEEIHDVKGIYKQNFEMKQCVSIFQIEDRD